MIVINTKRQMDTLLICSYLLCTTSNNRKFNKVAYPNNIRLYSWNNCLYVKRSIYKNVWCMAKKRWCMYHLTIIICVCSPNITLDYMLKYQNRSGNLSRLVMNESISFIFICRKMIEYPTKILLITFLMS